MKNIDLMSDKFDIIEGMTGISSVIHAIESGLSERKIIKILYNSDKRKSKYNELKYLDFKSRELGFELVPVSHTEIDGFAGGKTHGGFIAFCTRCEISKLSSPDQIKNNGFYIVLDGIEDPFNFAYAVRSVYAAGADGIIVPRYRFSEAGGTIVKGSAGTFELMEKYESEILSAIEIFKPKNYKIVSAGIRDSVSLYDADLTRPLLLIVGGEKRGISASVLERSDLIVRVDYGKTFRGSLTASSAATVLAFEVYRQNRGL